MTISFSECAASVEQLHRSLEALQERSGVLQLDEMRQAEWFQLLEQKLLPQMSDSAFLVAAVVGGTNLGKSVVFNHLAGSRASATSPLASGTRHPVCLVPEGFVQNRSLAEVFPAFELRDWSSAEAALDEIEQDALFWRNHADLPSNLLVLDTPDIDSDARINWERADKIRRSADVLVAVLTQQKYNDAAVKEFFRRAASEDKFVLVVFNQVHLPDDEQYWPLWMQTFCDETGIHPEYLYLAPHDRHAAETNTLPFLERSWPFNESEPGAAEGSKRQLNRDLSALRFGEIKLQTLRGSLEVLTAADGAESFLQAVRQRSSEYRSAAELLSTHKLAEIENWPSLPAAIVVRSIREWWQSQREGWSASVHGFYNVLNAGVISGWRFVSEKISGPQADLLERYRNDEWKAILDAVDKVYSRLNWFRELGNPLLQPRLTELLGATTRQALLDELRKKHQACELEQQVEQLVAGELAVFRAESPKFYKSLRKLDAVAAAVRPATSMVLFVTGFGPFGEAVGQIAAETAVSSAVAVAGDVAAGSATAAVGETWLASGTSAGVAMLEAHFRKIHDQFSAGRATWLARMLQEHLLGSLPEELKTAALIPESEEFLAAQKSLEELRQMLG
ncbi:MAG: GTPase [Planctomycetaceae bacterium]